MYKILQHPNPDDFVIATGEAHSVKEFLEEVFKYAGFNDWKILKKYFNSRALDLILKYSPRSMIS